jgi:hypothetical protein
MSEIRDCLLETDMLLIIGFIELASEGRLELPLRGG